MDYIVAITGKCIINLIVDAIGRNGLEKTLEDLRTYYTTNMPKSSEEAYQGFLISCKEIEKYRKEK